MTEPTPILPPEAPGARAARTCGILAIVFAATCVGAPVAVALGIVALVQQAKAKREAARSPQGYRPVPATGLVTGIIGLALPVLLAPVAGIASAIAIPALLGQRERARAKLVQAGVATVAFEADRLACEAPKPADPAQVVDRLLSVPEVRALRNPYDPAAPMVQKSDDAPAPGHITVCWSQGQGEAAATGFVVLVRGSYRLGGEVREIRKEVESD